LFLKRKRAPKEKGGKTRRQSPRDGKWECYARQRKSQREPHSSEEKVGSERHPPQSHGFGKKGQREKKP